MASLIAILDLKGKPLIQRSYRDDVPTSYVERFLPLVLEIEEDSGQQVTPCFSNQGINYMHIRHSNLYRMSCLFALESFAFDNVRLCSTCLVKAQY
jgi:AP-1 complex subunit mu